MAGKEDFTAEEWQQIITAPQMAAIYITLSSPSGIVGSVKEMMAFPKLILEATKTSTGNSLIDALASDFKAKIEKLEKVELPFTSKKPDEMKSQCLQACRSLAWMLAAKNIPEAEGFKQWIYKVAQLSAESAKEGGFLGFGGTRVSEAEVAALKDLAETLGIQV